MPGVMIQEKLPTVSYNGHLSILTMALVENAKLFKEDLLRRNVKNSNTLNLQTLRLGINSIIALSNALPNRKVTSFIKVHYSMKN